VIDGDGRTSHEGARYRSPAFHGRRYPAGLLDERGQFIVEDGERIDGVWLTPEEEADVPLVVSAGPGC
jgi:hypothetical protein